MAFARLNTSGKWTLRCGLALVLFAPIHGAKAETVLYSFTGSPNGATPLAPVIRDSAGNLYGTTYFDPGTAFKLAPDGTMTVLHAFTGLDDGGNS